MNAMLPVCYFPIKTFFVDDDVSFIQSILLTKQNYHHQVCHSPAKALDYLLTEYQSGLPLEGLFKSDDNIVDADYQRLVNIDVKQIETFVQKNKDNEIGVLFVDYHMPEMTGVEFLRKIKHLPMKKILFTGMADYQVGVEAFNEGLIDGYLKKGDVNFIQQLNAMETEQRWKFFEKISEKIIATDELNYLTNPAVNEQFKSKINTGEIKTFCLKHLQGDFKITTATNEEKMFLIRSKSQLNELATLAEEDGATETTITQLKNAESIPYFNNQPYWQTPASEWGGYLLKTTRLLDTECYWAIA